MHKIIKLMADRYACVESRRSCLTVYVIQANPLLEVCHEADLREPLKEEGKAVCKPGVWRTKQTNKQKQINTQTNTAQDKRTFVFLGAGFFYSFRIFGIQTRNPTSENKEVLKWAPCYFHKKPWCYVRHSNKEMKLDSVFKCCLWSAPWSWSKMDQSSLQNLASAVFPAADLHLSFLTTIRIELALSLPECCWIFWKISRLNEYCMHSLTAEK